MGRVEMDTIIKKIILRKCEFNLRQVVKFTDGSEESRIFSLIAEFSNGKVSGFGECVPTSLLYEEGHIGRSSLDEWKILKDVCVSLLGKDIVMLSNWIPEFLRDVYDANSVVDCIDFGIYDLAGRIMEVPVQALLGGIRKKELSNMIVVHTDTPDAMAEKAERYFKAEGFRFYKLKPNADLEKDRESMIKIQEKIPVKCRFYIDPNYALKMSPDEVVEYLEKLKKYGLEVCEDPLKCDFETYRYIQERTEVRIMLDDPARTLSNILDIIKTKCVRQINIHANWGGGFQTAVRKAALAAVGGIEAMVGSSIYLGIGNAAYRIIASVLPGVLPCEQASACLYTDDAVVEKEFVVKDGLIKLPDKPGLGVEVNRDRLEAVTLEKMVIE